RHRGAHALDRLAVAGEAAAIARRLGQDEQQSLVIRQEVAGALAALAADGEQAPHGERYGVGRSRRPAICVTTSCTKRRSSEPFEVPGLLSRPRSRRPVTNAWAMEVAIPSTS